MSDVANALKRLSGALIGLVAMVVATSPAVAVIDPTHQFIQNGGFETTTNGLGQLRAQNTSVPGWTSQNASGGYTAFTYVMNASTASTTGSPGEAQLKLWGPGTGANNGLANSLGGTGGNFVGADGGYHQGKLTQTITGLIVGQSYSLTFDFAGAQEYGGSYNGATTDKWLFGLQGQGLNSSTATLNNVAHGFTGWQTQTYNFVATSTSDTLYFLASGTPSGQPPFSLLDNVSLIGAWENGVSAAPEPGTWLTMLIGFGIIGSSLRTARRKRPGTVAFAA